jgi:hypothetical protein
VGFQGWHDGAPRVRAFTTQLEDASFTATYGGEEVLLEVELTSPVPGITPGAIDFQPGDQEGWIPAGETVVVTAEPRTGFGFQAWTGGLAGRSNPASISLTEPMSAGALFDLTFSLGSNPEAVDVQGGVFQSFTLEAANANLPVTWRLMSGSFPQGLTLTQSGQLSGTPREGGTFPVILQAQDAIGLQADLTLTVQVVDPALSATQAAAPFLLTGEPLSGFLQTFLDRVGNADGNYDLGDFRAFVLRNPGLPVSEALEGLVELAVSVGVVPERERPGRGR